MLGPDPLLQHRSEKGAAGGREPDERRILEVHFPTVRVGDHSREGCDPDRPQRRRRGNAFGELREENEQRHRDEPAADTEKGGEDPRHDADGDQTHAAYRMDMTCRAMVVALFSFGAVLGLAGPASSDPAAVGSSFYVVRGDPHLCPSPLCGGYWVALANRARTRCSDGALRPRCYVAKSVDEARRPLSVNVPEEALVRAEHEAQEFPSFGKLGVLLVAEVWKPVGGPAKGDFYRLRDTGVRCIRAPCFSVRAARLNGRARFTFSDLDLKPTGTSNDDLALAVLDPQGLLAAGKASTTEDGGRVFRATRIYLRAAKPRA